jgi:hypothetical protein
MSNCPYHNQQLKSFIPNPREFEYIRFLDRSMPSYAYNVAARVVSPVNGPLLEDDVHTT